ncbi:hypothetical protein [Micromonospora sp. CPCC 205556]|uniref:hypothetical protein n=1 Tax=Micromonospora sp. CPCC 205556 TaxID=3122398 RepID=UPI002FF29A13
MAGAVPLELWSSDRPGAVPIEVSSSGRADVHLLGALGRRLPAALRAWTSYSAFGAVMAAHRVRALVLVGVVAGLLGATTAGPVGGAVLAGYGVLGARAALGRRAGRLALRERRRRLDQLSALAADLRAGRPIPTLSTGDVGDGDRFIRLTRAAVRLADRTGAPLAELLERIEADARSLDRGLAAASAQAAGARATALLLAALPLGGIGLGYGIGADPLSVLLHTPLGAACAVTAVGLQVVGLLWAERLGRPPVGGG